MKLIISVSVANFFSISPRDLRIKYCFALVINDMSCEVRRGWWNWLGHILRKEGENDCFTALGWTPEGGQEEDQKLYLEKDSRERAKQSWVDELGSTSGCAKQKVLVRQRGGLICLLAR